MKKKYWIFGSIGAVVLAALIWFIWTYTIIGGHIYDRDVTAVNLADINLRNPTRVAQLESLQVADLRNTGLTAEEYDQIRGALPDCEILWLVPFQGDYLDPNSTTLTLSAITEEEMPLLAYFPTLQTIDMKTCNDVDAILKVIELYPQCDVQWMVPFQGGFISDDVENLEISTLSQEDISDLQYFTSLKSIDANACTDLDIIMELYKQYPDLDVQWQVPIGGTSYAQDSVDLEIADADATELSAQLQYLPQLKTLTLTGIVPDNDTMYELKQTYPEITFIWDFQLCGVTVNSNVAELDLSKIQMESVDEVENSLKYFNCLEKVIMFRCGIPSEDMDALWKRHPEIRFVWGACFGGQYVRTDTDHFMPWQLGYTKNGVSGMSDYQAKELKYLVDVVAIDIGHNSIRDLSFLYYMPNVEYLMACDCGITDLTPIASLKKLKYLELFDNPITDLSPLVECPALEDLNISHSTVSDITPLLGMNLKNIWITTWRLLPGQRELLFETFADAKICANHLYSTGGGWRKLPNYYAQRDILGMFYMSSDL